MNILTEYFEAPAMLLHLALVAAVAALLVLARNKRRRLLATWPGILKQSDRQRQGWPWLFAIRVVGLSCLVIAIAGPRGGEEKVAAVAGRRDVIVVLDVSRSMLAEQPSRLAKAVRSLRTLTDGKRLPQGTRVGLVVFAARPWLAFPLTADFDHLGVALDQIAAGEIPPEVRGNPDAVVSGTRLGAAIRLAVESFPATNSVRDEIVLLSDGDDPLADDEWLQGVTVARTRGVPVNVVAIGELGVSATIPYRGDVLQFEGTVVKTQVDRARLDEIAQRTGGLSLTLDRGDLPLANFLAKRWTETPPPVVTGDPQTTADVRPTRRFPWLLAAMFAFLAAEVGLAWPKWLSPNRWTRAVAGLACLVLVSAEPEAAGQVALRRGQEAFARQEYAAALRRFDEAQPLLADPSLAAFNRGAAHFRLKNFSAAAQAYRQVLDDPAVPTDRRDRAWFDFGNSLLHQAGTTERVLLEESIAAYKRCLASEPSAELKRDAEFNLAIAGRRLALTKPPETPKGNDPKSNENSSAPKNKDPDDPGKSPGTQKTPGNIGADDPPSPESGDPSKKPALGKITSLPDDAKLEAMSPAETARALAGQIERIAEERHRDRQTRDVAATNGKDW